jgi:hypothetical protein
MLVGFERRPWTESPVFDAIKAVDTFPKGITPDAVNATASSFETSESEGG